MMPVSYTHLLILYYIKVAQEKHPGEKLYLADLAAAMGPVSYTHLDVYKRQAPVASSMV